MQSSAAVSSFRPAALPAILPTVLLSCVFSFLSSRGHSNLAACGQQYYSVSKLLSSSPAAVRCGCEPATVTAEHFVARPAELPKPLIRQRPKQLEITTLLRSDDANALFQIAALPQLQQLRLNIRLEALESPVFAEALVALNATLSTADVSFSMSLCVRAASKSDPPQRVPIDQPTPWEYLGQLSSLHSLAITCPPDSAQTATGRSFQNLHNLRELVLPGGPSQRAMRTILNSLPALQSLTGGVIRWARDTGQVTLTPQHRSLTHLQAAWIEAAFLIDLQAVGVQLQRLTLSSGAMPMHRPTLPLTLGCIQATTSLTALTIKGFSGVSFPAVASIIASLPRLSELAVEDIPAEELMRSNLSAAHRSQLLVNTTASSSLKRLSMRGCFGLLNLALHSQLLTQLDELDIRDTCGASLMSSTLPCSARCSSCWSIISPRSGSRQIGALQWRRSCGSSLGLARRCPPSRMRCVA